MKKLFYITMFTLGLSSCDYTNLQPTDFVGTEAAFKNIEAIDKAVIGAYSKISLRSLVQLTDYISDDAVQGGQAGGAGTDSYQWTYTASKGDHASQWSSLYSIINQTNRIILNSEHLAGQEGYDNALGQAYFIRAYAHFDLLRLFSDFTNGDNLGIPYVSKAHVFGLPARDKVSECFAALNKDLNRALIMIEADAPSGDASYLSKTAVYGLMARIALYEGNYSHARIFASEALAAVPMATMEEYAGIWSDKSTSDVIWKVRRHPGEESIGTIFYGGDNSNVFGPSKKFMAIYEKENDIRLALFTKLGPDREGDIVDVVKKYEGNPENVGLNDHKLIRSSEMQLIVAEAYYMEGDLAGANAALNKIRLQRIADWDVMNYSSSDFKAQLIIERRRELVYEGHRFFDARRLGDDLVRDNGNKLSSDSHLMVMPIPQGELEANINISTQQNNGY